MPITESISSSRAYCDIIGYPHREYANKYNFLNIL